MKRVFIYLMIVMLNLTASSSTFGSLPSFLANHIHSLNKATHSDSGDCHHQMHKSETAKSTSVNDVVPAGAQDTCCEHDKSHDCCQHSGINQFHAKCCGGECGKCLNSLMLSMFAFAMNSTDAIKSISIRYLTLYQQIPDAPLKSLIIPPIYST